MYVVRHAKSSWEHPLLIDFDRPLNERGLRDAPRMAKKFRKEGYKVDVWLSSPAKRAIETAFVFSEELGKKREDILQLPGLYHASAAGLLDHVRRYANGGRKLAIFGHNPGLTDFVNLMAPKERIDNVPTTGVVVIKFEEDDFAKLKFGTGQIISFDYPKKQ
jgi:phosphohistidine phosphatase